MKSMLIFCLVLGTLLSGSAQAQAWPSYLHLDVEATFTLLTDGTVRDVEVSGVADEPVRGRLSERLEQWKFEIPEDEEGQGESIEVLSRFALVSVPDGDQVRMFIRRPSFSARALGAPVIDEDWSLGGQQVQRTAIRHPGNSATGSAAYFLDIRVELLVAFDGEGQVTRVGVASVELFDVRVPLADQRHVQRMLAPYVRAASNGLRRWRFPARTGWEVDGEEQVLVPVEFQTAGRSRPSGTWRHAVSADSMVDDWARRDMTAPGVSTISEASGRLQRRLTLVDSEQDLVL